VRAGGSSPFYRGRGSTGEGWLGGGGNSGVIGFNAIEDGGEVKRGGLRGGE
jgi:hypothetical protein